MQRAAERGRAAILRAGLGLALGACLTLGGALLHARLARRPPLGEARPGSPAWLLADRDGDALVELDRELLVVRRLALESPLLVRAGGGRVWVVQAPTGSPGGPRRLLLWRPGASPLPLAELAGEPLDLAVDELGRALVLVRAAGGRVELERIDGAGERCLLAAPRGAARLAAAEGRLAVGLGAAGWAERDPRTGSWALRGGPDGARVCDLAPGPGGHWWLLVTHAGEPRAQLVELDSGASPRRFLDAGGARRMARGAAGRAWGWREDARLVWRPADGGGTQVVALSLGGARAALADEQGGLLVAAAGAVLRLAPGGGARPGQAGFARLVDLESLEGAR